MKNSKLVYYFMIFILGALVGYIYEVIFYYITLGFVNNWGILYGPYLPIYGIGALFLSKIKVFKSKPILVFLSSMVITFVVEYIFGFISFNVFNIRLWDYRGLFLNVGGFVCFRSIFTFAVGSMFLVYIFEPLIEKICDNRCVKIISLLIALVFVIDIVFSVFTRSPYTF